MKSESLKELYKKEYVDSFEKNRASQLARIRNIVQYIDLDPKDVVADFACGNGLLAEVISDKVNEYHGVDFSEAFIDAFRQKISNNGWSGKINAHCSDIVDFCRKHADFFNKTFTLDFSEHICDEDFMVIYSGIYNSLKQGGSLFLHTPNGDFFVEILKNKGIMEQFPEHVAVRNANSYLEMLEKIGFRNIEIKYLPHYNILRYLHPFSFIPLIGKYFKARLLIVCYK